VTRARLMYSAVAVLLAAVVALLAAGMAGEEARGSVLAGAAVALGFQLLVFWAVTALFPGQAMLAFGLGMMGRFALVAAVALVVAPLAGWVLAPTLLTLVSVLFATTLLEPVFLRPTHGTGIDDR
jgi:hypothetical protein